MTITPKMLIATATLLLSVCASVFTFLALTKVETWMTTSKRPGVRTAAVSGSESTAKNPSYNYNNNTPTGYEYDDGPSFSIAETPLKSVLQETNAEIVADEAPQQSSTGETFSIQPPTSTPSIPTGSQSARQTLAGRIPPPQSSLGTSPRSSAGIPFIISNASTDLNLFALTFDGGSSANAAADILDTLASRGVKSTVFLTGAFIKRYPKTVMRIAAEGHELGNHTMNHPRLTTYAENRTQSTRPGVSRTLLINELTASEYLLFEQTEGLRFAPLWRAPFGEYNQEICEWALSAGYVHIGWRQGGSWRVNLDSNDWVADESSPAYRTPQEVFDKIINIARTPGGLNGGIILMHLGTERTQRSQQVHTILGKLIDTLVSMGYKPVTVSTLLYRSGIDIDLVQK